MLVVKDLLLITRTWRFPLQSKSRMYPCCYSRHAPQLFSLNNQSSRRPTIFECGLSAILYFLPESFKPKYTSSLNNVDGFLSMLVKFFLIVLFPICFQYLKSSTTSPNPPESAQVITSPQQDPGPQYHYKALWPLPSSGNECPVQIWLLGEVEGIWGKGIFYKNSPINKFLFFSFSLKVKNSAQKKCPLSRFPMCHQSQERTLSARRPLLCPAGHSPPPSPHCLCNVRNWNAEQRLQYHSPCPAGPKAPFLAGRKGFCGSRVWKAPALSWSR